MQDSHCPCRLISLSVSATVFIKYFAVNIRVIRHLHNGFPGDPYKLGLAAINFHGQEINTIN